MNFQDYLPWLATSFVGMAIGYIMTRLMRRRLLMFIAFSILAVSVLGFDLWVGTSKRYVWLDRLTDSIRPIGMLSWLFGFLMGWAREWNLEVDRQNHELNSRSPNDKD